MQTSGANAAASAAAGLLTSTIVVDAAVETWIAGSPVRLVAVIAALAWLLVSGVLWRMNVRWQQQLAGGALAMLALLTITAWRPGGLDYGVQMLRQPTPTLVSWATALALVAAAIISLRATAIPLMLRGAVCVLAAYGVATFVFGGWHAVSYPALLDGSGPWRQPAWLLRVAVVCGLAALPIALGISALGGLARDGRLWRPQQIVALVLAVVLVVSGFTSAAPQVVRLDLGASRSSTALPPAAPAAAPAVAAAPTPVDGSIVADVASAIGKPPDPASTSRFDANRRADEIGSDPAKLFAFVHDTIAVQVYPGVLRGARGTLVAGAGNAWDQATLLADLLRHHGREVRFAAGRLSPADAAAVVDRMFADASRHRPAAAAMPGVSESIRTRGGALVARVNAAWQSAHADIVAALEKAGLTLGDASASEAMLNADAADHAWVEYRDGDRWVPLDPVARNRPGEAAVAAVETMAEIPDGRQHRVTIRYRIETRRDQALKTTDVLTFATPAAALDGTPVAIELQVERGSLAAWRARPILQVGDRRLGQRWFTDAGPLFRSGRSTIVGEAHQQMGRLGSVTEAFGGPPAASAVELTAAWIEVEFSTPGGATDTVRRDVFDRIGAAARNEGRAATAALRPLARVGDVPAALNGVYGLAFTSGGLDPAVVWEQLGSERETIDQVLSGAGGAQQQASKGLRALPRILWSSAAAVHVLSQQLSAQLRAPAGPAVFYEATPRLAIASLEIVLPAAGNGGAAASIALDLRRNGLRAVAKGAGAADTARVNLARGVLDGAIEDAVVSELAAALDPHPATVVSLLAKARAEGVTTVAWRGAAAVPALTLPDDPRARLQAAATESTAIVGSPRAAPPGAARAGWWQIDLRSGEATAMLDDGLHGARARLQDEEEEALIMVEYLPLEGGPMAESYEAAKYGSWIGAIIVGVIIAVLGSFMFGR